MNKRSPSPQFCCWVEQQEKGIITAEQTLQLFWSYNFIGKAVVVMFYGVMLSGKGHKMMCTIKGVVRR